MFKLRYKDNPNRSFWLVGEKFTLGRDKSNSLVLDGLGIDDFHAEIEILPDSLILKSKSGSCYVNDLPVDNEYPLVSGDELRIGLERLQVIDPKTGDTPQAQTAVPPVSPNKTTTSHWSIVPDHQKLKDKDFSVVGRCVLGRSKDCEFSVPYRLLSREHAALTVIDNTLTLEDLGSSNGCFVNGTRVEKAKLKDGDTIAFAKLAFTVKSPSEPALKTAVSADEEINKTIIRPAVDIQAELAKAEEPVEHKGPPSLDFLQREIERSIQEEKSRSHKTSRWIAVAVVITLLVVAGFWFSPLNSFG